MSAPTIILGGGVTGLAAGIASGCPVYEAEPAPGGICSSYYVRPGSTERLISAPADGEAYRFEIGGGHWIFGGDPTILKFIRSLTPVKSYGRLSSVYFPDCKLYVPYPLQNHLRVLGPEIATKALAEMANPQGQVRTMQDWLLRSFGPTLCDLFFVPFHELYTAGLYKQIAPQDDYKSPVSLPLALKGAFEAAQAVGYNTQYLYPEEGLNTLAKRMGERCDLRYGKRVVKIDATGKAVHFADGSSQGYAQLLCTLPLNKAVELSGVKVESTPDPHSSVLVLNLGAVRGPACPPDHWLYHQATQSGFHRVGFYSNVDRSFLPKGAREKGDRVSIYVERAYVGGQRPSDAEQQAYGQAVVKELQAWGYIGAAEVVDPTWIDVAYTWQRPGSKWRAQAMAALEAQSIYPVGRYARWTFQGIADSIRDGFYAGSALKDPR